MYPPPSDHWCNAKCYRLLCLPNCLHSHQNNKHIQLISLKITTNHIVEENHLQSDMHYDDACRSYSLFWCGYIFSGRAMFSEMLLIRKNVSAEYRYEADHTQYINKPRFNVNLKEFSSIESHALNGVVLGRKILHAIHFAKAMITTNTKNLSKCRDCLMSNRLKCQNLHVLTSTYVNWITLFKFDWNASRRTHNGSALKNLRTWINAYVGCVAYLLWTICKQCMHTHSN